ncbi:fumarylacetoacetate hydrolase family protein [Paracoccus aminophilus]|uniref:Fumarylacetoacetate (FAA) hydrolase n=1 Tax=Paracoccus aminophilus JCM 7686 TaxID=1367847 RepID=S5Y3I8_PARAH|nr:fumarylacetoacetate hydrolase family protein [Paracoccus aminophilus]AGT10320.1 fumarylacetoacetate (FAA) hydrolase [Paracoccus aminophilus JCM 7686]
MTEMLFPPAAPKSIAVHDEAGRYPVNRIFCVGRNYAAHAAEMGNEVDREAPFYFLKGPHAVQESGTVLPYPPGTADFHYELELVVAIGAPAFRIGADQVENVVFGYGLGLDMTRRDLQARSKDKRQPWDTGKDVEGSAVLGPLTRRAAFGAVAAQRIHLALNGQIRQDAHLSDMVWSVAEIIADLSRLYHLAPGDLIMTGTPAGVGAVTAGDRLEGGIDGLGGITLTIGRAEEGSAA